MKAKSADSDRRTPARMPLPPLPPAAAVPRKKPNPERSRRYLLSSWTHCSILPI